MFKRVAVLGAGSWGIALARLLDANGLAVKLWEHNAQDFLRLLSFRTQPDKLQNVQLSDSINITHDLREAVDSAEMLVLAVPAQYLRSVLDRIRDYDLDQVSFVNVAKGIETQSLKRMSEMICEALSVAPNRVTTLSGPSHAEEVVLDMPTAVVVGGLDETLLARIQAAFSNQNFRVYQSTDIIGVELGGSLKNIIAIAAGIMAGLKLGDNTMGALITRGLAEITRLGVAMGAQAATFAGLSGIGDLVTTCSSKHSRNRFVGEQIGRGEKLAEILSGMTMVAEGVETTRAGHELSLRHHVEMPITSEVFQVLFKNKAADQAVGDLMGRKLKAEIWF